MRPTVGVGMTITNRPLHRSGRALLTHPAPALGDDAKSSHGIRVMNSRRWQPMFSQTLHLLPRQVGFLTSTPQRPTPVTDHVKAKRRQRVQVRRHTIVPIVSRDYRPKPLAHFSHSMVHSFAQFRFDLLQLRSFPLTHRPPIDREHSAALLATDVREAQKVECFRFPFATPLSIVCCVVAKLDDARFLGMQFQFELGETFRQFVMKPRGVRLVLKAHHEVISPADDNHVAFGFCLAPVLHPEVEHVVQIDVGQQRRGTAALWRPFFTARPLPLFQHACVQPLAYQSQYPLVHYPVFEELHQPFMVQTIEEPADVSIQHPAHLSRQQPRVQSIQRFVLALAGPVTIRETEKVSLIDCIQQGHCRSLDDLIFQRSDAERPEPPVCFADESPQHCLCPISPAPQSACKLQKTALQLLAVLPPRFPIYSRSRVTLQFIKYLAQHTQVVDMVHQADELRPFVLHGCLPYPLQRTLHDFPILGPVRVLPQRFPFGQPPSLHLLRLGLSVTLLRLAFVVRKLRRCYGSVRLPASVHHRRTSLDFTMRPKRAGLGGRRISRFSRRLFPCMPGVSDLAGFHHALPKRHVDCCLPHLIKGSASRTEFISLLNTRPARTPVNASPDESLHSTHDSGPLWLARPSTYDSFIHNNLPVYPGAQ